MYLLYQTFFIFQNKFFYGVSEITGFFEGKKLFRVPMASFEMGEPVVSFLMDEVEKHNRAEDCWIVIHQRVIDVTSFLNSHPGGASVILDLVCSTHLVNMLTVQLNVGWEGGHK